VTLVSPTSGPTAGGTSVTVTGTNLTGASAVSFGGTAAASFIVNSATSITAVSPAEAAGTVDITVTTVGGTSATSSADQFTFVAAPTVTSVSPTAGPTAGGTAVTVTGTGFTPTSQVHFGATAAAGFHFDSATQLSVVSPAEAAGTVHVTVTTVGGTSSTSSADQFTFMNAPTVTSVVPNSGPTGGGTDVTITGTNFASPATVAFGGNAATNVVVVSTTSITATSPAGGVGTVDVTVTTPGGTSGTVAGDHFTYTGGPNVTSVSPTSGPTAGGTSVTITGTGFTGASTVHFGGTVAASFGVNSDTSITAVSPAEAAGTVDVTVTTPGGTSPTSSADDFTFVSGPIVTSVSPNSGPTAGGTSVTITGTGFTGATSVDFGGTAAASFAVNSDTSIMAVSPAEAAGTVDVTVTAPGGTSATSGADQFTFVPPPAITAINPNTGPTSGGTSVAITGTGFTGATGVTFGGVAATGVTVNSDSSITAISPPHLPAIGIAVMVTTPIGTSAATNADKYTYIGPYVTKVSPLMVSTGGGNTITVSGYNFTGATGVTVGGNPASSVTVVTSKELTAVVPAGAVGKVNVEVTTPVGTSPDVAADMVTYQVPAVTKIAPMSGPANTATTVVLTGKQLSLTSAVDFGSAPATFHVNSNTSITATAPPQPAGKVAVTITTTAGVSTPTAVDDYTYKAPTITKVSPVNGSIAGGTTVTITGTLFTGASSVTFGGVAASSFTFNSATSITAVSPAHAAGLVDVQVTATAGTTATVAYDHFTYQTPSVTRISPTSGPAAGGTTVTITGVQLGGATGVSFGLMPAASFTVVSNTTVTAVSPPGVGVVHVTVTTAAGQTANGATDRFTYKP
jgi:hypothetical protein